MIHCRTSSSVKRAFVRASHGAEHPQLRTGKQQYDLWIIRIQIHLHIIHFWTTFFGSNVSDSNPSCTPFRRHLGRKVEAFWLQNRQWSRNNHRRTCLWGSRVQDWEIREISIFCASILLSRREHWDFVFQVVDGFHLAIRRFNIFNVFVLFLLFWFWVLWYNWLTHASAPRWMSSPSDNFCNNWPNH